MRYYVLADKDANPITLGDVHDIDEPLANLPIASTDRTQVEAVLQDYCETIGDQDGWQIIEDN
jgi:hypothetical protein